MRREIDGYDTAVVMKVRLDCPRIGDIHVLLILPPCCPEKLPVGSIQRCFPAESEIAGIVAMALALQVGH